ncbi:MAG: sortase [Candidatus Amesbacteria bacterium]|nr:sortase [Candidatus Amesbacteria bacterium]
MKDWIPAIGAMILTASIIGIIWIYVPIAYYQVKYTIRERWYALGKLRGSWSNPVWTATGDYMIYVPRIDAKAPVVAQVDSANEKEYFAALKKGVAEAAGLSVPGRRGTTYLFAHSTDNPLNFSRYNAIFYLLDKMKPDDRVELYYKGNYYHYKVEKMEILAASDTRYLVPQYTRELLVLQTCYPFGTTQKRLVIVATPLDR